MRKNFTRAVLFFAFALPLAQTAGAAELYAQAIGQPPEPRAPAAPKKPPEPPPAAAPPAAKPEPPPETTAKTDEPPADGNLTTRILIGAGIALALGALGGGGGGGGGGGDTTPAHSPGSP